MDPDRVELSPSSIVDPLEVMRGCVPCGSMAIVEQEALIKLQLQIAKMVRATKGAVTTALTITREGE